MWVFDGETWIEEGTAKSEIRPDRPQYPEEGEFYPELQVEIVEIPLTPERNIIPLPFVQ